MARPALYNRERARRSLFDTITWRTASQIATMLGYVFLVRGMSKQDFGVLNLLYAFLPVTSAVASLGLEQTMRRFQPEYLSSGNRPAAAWLVRVIATARFTVNAVLITAVLLAWNLVAPLFKLTPYRMEFALFSVVILLTFQYRILQFALAAHMLHRISIGSMAVLSLTKCIAYATLFWLHSLTLKHAIFADSIACGLTYVLLKWAQLRHCTPPPGERFRPDATERRRLLRYGFYNNFNDAGALLLGSRVDNFFIAALVNPVAVGAYAFFVRLNEMISNLLPIRLFDNLIQPLFFAIPANDAERRVPRYLSLLLNANLLLQLPAAAYVTCYHAEIVKVLFGGKFIEFSWLLPVIVGFATMNIVATPVTLVAQHAEKAATILLSKIFVIYGIAATLLLLPVMGLYGVAIATGSSQLFKNLFIWWQVRRTARWLNFRSVAAMTLLIWGSVIALCYGAKQLISAPPLVHMALGALICLAGWLLYVRSPAVSKSDREILAGVMRGRESRVLRLLGLVRSAQ